MPYKVPRLSLIGGPCLKEGGVYFKVRGINHLKFQHFHFLIICIVVPSSF